jgi:hypothetical protein
MTKKDYELIARKLHYMTTISEIYSANHGSINKDMIRIVITDLVEKLGEGFAKDNPKFDYGKFVKAVFNPDPKKEKQF